LFSLPEFKTKVERMGKVALVSQRWVRYYQTSNVQVLSLIQQHENTTALLNKS